MKRILLVLLCFCLLIPSALTFTSCAKSISVDISVYQIVYPKGYITAMREQVRNLGSAIDEKTGAALSVKGDTGNATQYEILVGQTTREESATVLSKIKGDGYAIAVENDKIVIVGTNDALTVKAMQVFAEGYLAGEPTDSKTITLKKREVVSKVSMLEIAPSWQIIYSESLDDDKGCVYDPGDTFSRNPDQYDYPVVASKNLSENLVKLIAKGFDWDSDDMMTDFKNCILVGDTTAELSGTFMRQLDADTYGFVVKDNMVAVSGSNDAGIQAAALLFKNIAESCLAVNASGETVIRLPADFTWLAVRNTDWFTDFPRPEGEGITFEGSLDVADQSVEFYYTGDGVNEAAFEVYCNTLKDAGYTVHTENTIGKSRFVTLVNKEKRATLHVIYGAFEYAAQQKATEYQPSIRIISSYLLSVNLPDEAILSPDLTYTRLTDSKLTSVNLDSSYGNSYVITLEDGSFIVYDGGSSDEKTDADQLYSVLSQLHTTIKGSKPSAEAPIVIAAWLLSHGHGDHFAAFDRMCGKYGNTIKIERFLFNGSSDEEDFNSHNPNSTVRDNAADILSQAQGNAKYIKVHAGQKFYVRNVEIEVLYTHEDLYPVRSDFFNDTSTVFRTTIYSTDGNGNRVGEGTTTMWLGDLYMRGSKYLRAMYGATLQSDMVQVAHHGWQGCEWSLYQLIAPECVLWPVQLSTFRELTSNQYSSTYHVATDYKICNELKSVKIIIVADIYHTTITFTANGPDYALQKNSATGLYNAGYADSGKLLNEENPITGYRGAILVS